MNKRKNYWWALLLALSSFSHSQETQVSATQISGLEAQLKSGETTYFLACAMCHGDRLEGVSAPPLSGEAFTSTYAGLPVSRLTTFVAEQMPEDAPGSLSKQEVLAVSAYLLHENQAALPDAGLNQSTLENPVQFSGETP